MSGEHCCRGRVEMHVCSAAVAEVGKDSGMTKVCVSKPEVSCSNLYLLAKPALAPLTVLSAASRTQSGVHARTRLEGVFSQPEGVFL